MFTVIHLGWTRCIWCGLRTVRSEGATVYRGKLADELFASQFASSIYNPHTWSGLTRCRHCTRQYDRRSCRSQSRWTCKRSVRQVNVEMKRKYVIGLGNKVGSNCFKTNKYTYLKRDMLCIVQVFERAVSAPHANKEEVRSLLPANDSHPVRLVPFSKSWASIGWIKMEHFALWSGETWNVYVADFMLSGMTCLLGSDRSSVRIKSVSQNARRNTSYHHHASQ